jgi:hypothetical protein
VLLNDAIFIKLPSVFLNEAIFIQLPSVLLNDAINLWDYKEAEIDE